MRTRFLFLLILSPFILSATGLHVGSGYPYPTLGDAVGDAVPGDSIIIHQGVYSGGIFVNSLQGESDNLITIIASEGENVVFEGGTNAWQFSDAAYLHIEGFTFREQTGNGLNFDDGGSYETPAHHITFTNCIFRDIDASGNNDLLKLSGLNDFEISNCLFVNGSPGGSGVDMVGCHDGLIYNCSFENMGTNSIQAKGGTSNIRIVANLFKNGGNRSINMGGSTGLEFFRPLDATYEASQLKVYSNIFIGSEAPIAFVGCILSEVVNNTIYLPGKWVLRILQETVDPDRFEPCGQNVFRNNIVYMNENVNVVCNIGPNTAPETFTFSNNLWHHTAQGSNWTPSLPVTEENQISNVDPEFINAGDEDFNIQPSSPAVGNGFTVSEPVLDHEGELFQIPRSIGAFEGAISTSLPTITEDEILQTFPNPVLDEVKIGWNGNYGEVMDVYLMNVEGKIYRNLKAIQSTNQGIEIEIPHEAEGLLWVVVVFKENVLMGKIVKAQ